MLLAWVLCGVLLVMVAVLSLKVWLMKRGMNEICAELEEHLSRESNVLISVSSGDKHIRHLAAELNKQLRILRRQRQRYVSSDRELKEAVTNISHDLRTPLTAICGYLDLLENIDKSETVSRYLSAIKNRTEIMKQLTEELFSYRVVVSAENEDATEPILINNVLEDSIAGFYALLREKGIVPSIHMTEKKVIRKLNKEALSRVFSNLLTNAIKYSDGDLDITLTDAGEIVFTNTASALNKVQAEKMFDRFYTVNSARKSTGLGLAIARTLTQKMNGTIVAEYDNNKLSICISLPDDYN